MKKKKIARKSEGESIRLDDRIRTVIFSLGSAVERFITWIRKCTCHVRLRSVFEQYD